MTGPRPSREEYGLALARTVALRGDCVRRRVGAVLIDADGRVVSTGYNGAPAGSPGCLSDGACPRANSTAPAGQGYEASGCIALHAELNAVIYAGRAAARGCTLFVTHEPCYLCRQVIAAAAIDKVVVA